MNDMIMVWTYFCYLLMKELLDTGTIRWRYGLQKCICSAGARHSIGIPMQTVKRNQQQYSVPLVVVSYKDLYGWTMDDIVAAIGLNSNCTFCGVFRRQALDRGAALCHADKVVTGHNADDVAETVLMNILRGDIARLGRCTSIVTGAGGFMPRSKPFKYVYEKEIVMYAYFNKLDYFSTECIYSPNAYRGYAREFLKDLEAVRATSILDIIHAAEHMAVRTDPAATTTKQTFHACAKCGYMSSQPVCQACVLLNGLNTGKAKLALNDSSARSKLVQQVALEAQAKSAAAAGCSSTSGGSATCGCTSAGAPSAAPSQGCCSGGSAAGAPLSSAGTQCCSQSPAVEAGGDDASKRVAVLIRRAGHMQDVLLRSTAQWDAMDGEDVLAPQEETGSEGVHARPIMAGVATSVHDW